MNRLVVIIVVCTVLGACDEITNQSPIQDVNFGSVRAWTDPDTGCQYIKEYNVGITPRLDASGHPMCGVSEQ